MEYSITLTSKNSPFLKSQDEAGSPESSTDKIPVFEQIDGVECPEGGRSAWMAVLGSFLVYFVSFGFINSFGVFQDFYANDYLSDYSETAIALIGSLQTTLMYTLGIIIGPMFDSKGPRYLYSIGMLGSTASLLLLSFTRPQQIWQQFLSQSVLFGASVGFGYYPALSIIGQYFKRRRALVIGIVGAGSSMGGVCFPIMFSRLFEIVGFAWSARVAALITLVCYSIAILVSRARLPPKRSKGTNDLVDFDGFADLRYSVLAIGCVLVYLGVYTPYNYIASFAEQYNVSDSIRTYLLAMMNGVSLFGRLIGGQLADTYGCLNILAPSTFIAGVLCLSLWLTAPNTAALVVFACSYGFFSGIFTSVSSAAVTQLSPVDKLGARVGTFFLPIAGAVLVGTPVSGAFVRSGTKEEYQHLVTFAGVMIIAGSVALYAARILCSRNVTAKW